MEAQQYNHITVHCQSKILWSAVIIYPYSQAVRTSIYGRPGVCYIDVPGNMVTDTVAMDKIRLVYMTYDFGMSMYISSLLMANNRFYPRCPDPPLTLADPVAVRNACEAVRNAERPLVIIGKGKIIVITCIALKA